MPERTIVGPHLLGRTPSPYDPDDWQLRDYMRAAAPWKTKVWEVTERLNQGNTGHCVGFDAADWCNVLGTENFDDQYQDKDGHEIYYECKVIDKEPGAEDGSTIRSGAMALQNRGRLVNYAFASTMEEIKTYVCTIGPLMVGTEWWSDMFNPDADGFVRAGGQIAGGHAYCLIGYNAELDCFIFLNSWGSDWGLGGLFKIKVPDFKYIFTLGGEACAAVENTVVPAPPIPPSPPPLPSGCNWALSLLNLAVVRKVE